MKTILIAIPTEKYIEAETFKSIYDLQMPIGYTVTFKSYIGDKIDQLRNVIASHAKQYDYLLFVDSDIILPSDTLIKMINADKDIISALYIQRKPDTQIVEVYMDVDNGCVNIPYSLLEDKDIVEIAACGMGCALIKTNIFNTISFPYYFYTEALDHTNTISEDVYFCLNARQHGFSIWADTGIKCDHIGEAIFSLSTNIEKNIDDVYSHDMLPKSFVDYMENMNISPKVIYDIGSSVLHWESHATRIWPDAKVYLFEANTDVKKLYNRLGKTYYLGILSDIDNKVVKFYKNPMNLGGNSYYKENTIHYNETFASFERTLTLDTIVSQNNWPLPDLIKIDVQGAELDILIGSPKCLQHCSDIILECQHVDYNQNAPKVNDILSFMKNNGFELIGQPTSGPIDGDYHFRKSSI